MKISKIIYSPIIPVVITGVLLIVGFQYKDSAFRHDVVVAPINTSTPKELHDEIYALTMAKNYSEALEKAEIAIQLNPNYIEAWVDKGMALYLSGDCTGASAALYHAVNLDPEDERVGDMLGAILGKCGGTGSSDKFFNSKDQGFSFAISEGFTVLMEDKELGWTVVVKTEYARKRAENPDKEEPFDAVIISAKQTSPDFSALDWLKGPNSGYDLSLGYKETVIGGERAYLLDRYGKGRPDWALFDNPDKTLRFSVTTFGDLPSAEMTAEFENILDSFEFNEREM